jgi:hypothetical protein
LTTADGQRSIEPEPMDYGPKPWTCVVDNR